MPQLDKLYYINVGKDGTFLPSGDIFDTSAGDIDKMIESLKTSNQKRIVLYFHGGLVKTMAGMDVAERIYRYVNTGTKAHVITFVWETGLVETIKQNFATIGKSDFFNKLLIKIIKVAGKKLGFDLVGETTGRKGIGSLTEKEIEAELEKAAPFENMKVDVGKRVAQINPNPLQRDNDVYYETVVKTEITPDIEDEIYKDQAFINLAVAAKPGNEAELMPADDSAESVEGTKGLYSLGSLIKSAITITVKIIKRHLQQRDHGFYPTIVEEILREYYVADMGAWVWGRMKDKAKTMWKEDDFSGVPENWRAGSYLLKSLNDYQDKEGELIIDLVGHSAGSIAICELIKIASVRYHRLKFRYLIFMAPACRCELFAESILKNKNSFQHFRAFTMEDKYEIEDRLVKRLYTRSLLYLVSGILEEKQSDAYILGLQRHITANPPYDTDETLKEIAQYMKYEDHVVYSVSAKDAAEGMRTSSLSHSGFDDDKESTLDSMVYLINQ